MLLSGPLAAQVPNGHVLITHRETVGSVVLVRLTIVDPASGALTPLRPAGANLDSLQKGYIVNPGDGTQIWSNPSLSLVGSITMRNIGLQGSGLVTSKSYSVTGIGGTSRYHIVGPDLYLANANTGAPGGVYKLPIGTTTATQIATLPKANAMTSIGRSCTSPTTPRARRARSSRSTWWRSRSARSGPATSRCAA
jgi:hypothetical protein